MPQGTEAAEAAAAPAPKTLIDYIVIGGPVGFILIGLSIAAVTLIILNFIRLRRAYWMPRDVVDSLGRMLREQDLESAKRYCGDPGNACFVTNVIGLALARCSRSAFGFLELRSSLEEAGQIEADRQYRANDGLALIAALGPMLGLLGTVIGLIGAFGSIGELEGVTRSKELARFMSLALVNTAQGLAVAIPCTAFYAFFKRRIDMLATETALVIEGMTVSLEQKQGGAPAPAPRAPAAPGPARAASPRPAAESAPQGVKSP